MLKYHSLLLMEAEFQARPCSLDTPRYLLVHQSPPVLPGRQSKEMTTPLWPAGAFRRGESGSFEGLCAQVLHS